MNHVKKLEQKCQEVRKISSELLKIFEQDLYKSMMEHGKIITGDYASLCQTIKEEMNELQSDCARLNDPMEKNPFAFF